MKATIYDVAKEAGVSIATVSKVINGKGKISEKRRKEVLKIMERLQYQPSMIASALTGKKTYSIGLLVPDISNPFFSEIARSVEDQGHQLGYSLIICSTDNKDERIEKYIALLKQKKVDGIIIGTGSDQLDVLNSLSGTMPIAAIGREVPDVDMHTVVVDDYEGGRMAARHLLELGHTQFAVLSESLKLISSRERLRGFSQMLMEAGIEWSESMLKICDYRVEDGKRQALELFRQDSVPTALFCCNDMLAVGAYQAAKQEGIRIPSDLSVVSFDNTILATVTDPPLTSIAQPMEHMGKLCVDLLVDQLKIGNVAVMKQRVVLRPELVERHSTAPL
ncbi:LacI family DNA-binding transcriptional regulator [Paenibacillus gansuensis]|uniref:LacI family DNA-binding transcriptional regulator n=1 Tax=Paenibacillus gansuensis TaxID=306542 RepID=A0ABW5P818_9BACL